MGGSGRRKSLQAGQPHAWCQALAAMVAGRQCSRAVLLPLVPGACAPRTRDLGWSFASCDGTQTFILPQSYRNPGAKVLIYSCVRGLDKC